jgi:hypothetical protein
VGTPEYQMTAPVWIRGILSDHYGYQPRASRIHTGGEEEPGRSEKLKLDLPPSIKIKPIGPTQTLSAMLANGEIDALHTARMPSTFSTGGGKVRRLFENYKEVEQHTFRDTGIFPIMHTVVIRRELYEQNRWIAQALFKAFVEAQRRAYEDLYVTAALKAMLPWLTAHVEETRAMMGDDYWAYGFERNRATLATFLRYHHEQGCPNDCSRPRSFSRPRPMESFKEAVPVVTVPLEPARRFTAPIRAPIPIRARARPNGLPTRRTLPLHTDHLSGGPLLDHDVEPSTGHDEVDVAPCATLGRDCRADIVATASGCARRTQSKGRRMSAR